ncbi:RNA polymerase sigma-28 (SigD/FliA/WhiG) subunit [Terracoccus luteus]|uniref:RNA polymerase sigma-28 (SigD/FliA/WhiG) subunit n=1 Tax=Terracoccus luteus TaxID=53356 RepID=A0A495XRN9_9MICO|nr:sigma-70 family RNA polymerase sigma factor [Terracoccus luteus]RKT76767.1 RNA polymerase sigma-28 (SigD/FliA/WhiG) subunit [Terracoccus luteus]
MTVTTITPGPAGTATATSPVRSDVRTRELIAIIRETSDPYERSRCLDEAARIHMPLARSLAHRYGGRGLDRDDLEQVAYLALLKAISRFDLSKETEFGAYATPTITGELRRHFRDHGWLVRPPRALQERRQLVTQTRDRLEQTLGHAPDSTELATFLGLTDALVREAQVAASNLRPASLDATTADGDRPALELVHTASDPALDEGIVVRTAIGRLPARDQQLITLRFDDDLTQAEIASRMGLSAMQVSRLLRRALEELRGYLATEGVAAA